jgi:hypothetical protein
MRVVERARAWLGVGAAIVSVSVAAACAGAGRKWDTTHANDVRDGVQDKAQIETWFGKPYQVQSPLTGHPKGCTERWTYTHAWSNWGGAQTTTNTLVVDFDARGIVCDHAYVTN